MSYGEIELKCPNCKKEHIVGEFGYLGEPCFTEEGLLGFQCVCGKNLVVKYNVWLEEYEPEDKE